MNDFNNSSRRNFIKQAGLLAGLPFLDTKQAIALDSRKAGTGFRVLSCNIRVDLPEDNAKGQGWQHRREACIQVIKKQNADLIGFQEVLRNQFFDVKNELKDYFAFGFDGPEM